MEILQLKYFCDAAQTQNFSKTAKKYNVPTSNISQSIKRLEKELETPLFDHGKNRISLNRQGEVFYFGIKKMLDALEEAKASLRDSLESVSGEIRILACTNRSFLTQKIGQFKKLYPNVSFFLSHNQGTWEEFDFIISDEPASGKYYEKRILVSESFLIAMHREHPLAEKEHFSLSDLKNDRFITMQEPCSLHRMTVQSCRNAGFEPNITIQSDDPFYIRKYVELGLGVALVPSVSWQGTFSDTVILKKIDGIHRHTYLYRNLRKTPSKSVSLFYDILRTK